MLDIFFAKWGGSGDGGQGDGRGRKGEGGGVRPLNISPFLLGSPSLTLAMSVVPNPP